MAVLWRTRTWWSLWIHSNSAYYVILFVYELLHVLDRDIWGIFTHAKLKIVLTSPFPQVCETCLLQGNFLLHISFFYICLCLSVQAQIRHLTSDSTDLATIRTEETTQNFLLLWSGEKQLSASANAYTYLLTSFFVDVMMSLLIRENDLKYSQISVSVIPIRNLINVEAF